MTAGDVVDILLAAVILYACSFLAMLSRKIDELLRLLVLLTTEPRLPPHSRARSEH